MLILRHSELIDILWRRLPVEVRSISTALIEEIFVFDQDVCPGQATAWLLLISIAGAVTVAFVAGPLFGVAVSDLPLLGQGRLLRHLRRCAEFRRRFLLGSVCQGAIIGVPFAFRRRFGFFCLLG